MSDDSIFNSTKDSFHYDEDMHTTRKHSRRSLLRFLEFIVPSRIAKRIRKNDKRAQIVARHPYPNRILISTLFVLLVTSLAILTWLAVILTVADRLRLVVPNNGIQTLLRIYHAPNSTSSASPLWLPSFSSGIKPIQCHSHNDYWHQIPLYEGLSVGCVSTEADIWARKSEAQNGAIDLFVGHNKKSLDSTRTLRSLYLDPLMEIFTRENAVVGDMSGVFEMSPNTSLVLLLDFKESNNETWDNVVTQLATFREKGWLTHWTPDLGVVSRPLTVVATGVAPFAAIIANTTYRDIFYDAPITSLSATNDFAEPYHSNNSYYASASLSAAVGHVWFGKFSKEQSQKITEQVKVAGERGLKSRYWDTPAWPVGWRNRIWGQLVGLLDIGVEGAVGGMLNVDDLTASSRWDWNMCVLAGVNICSS